MSQENDIAVDEGRVKIDLSEEDAIVLLGIYVRNNLSKESKGIFCECLQQFNDVRKAIFRATLNEAIIGALQDQVSRKIIAVANAKINKSEDGDVNLES